MWLHGEYHRYLKSLASSSNSAENNFCLNIPKDRSSEGVPRRSSLYSRELEGFSGNGWKLEEHCARGAHQEWNLWQFTRLYTICSAKLFYAFSVTISAGFANDLLPLLIAFCVSQQTYVHPPLLCTLFENIYTLEIIIHISHRLILFLYGRNVFFSISSNFIWLLFRYVYCVHILFFFLFLFLIHVNRTLVLTMINEMHDS